MFMVKSPSNSLSLYKLQAANKLTQTPHIQYGKLQLTRWWYTILSYLQFNHGEVTIQLYQPVPPNIFCMESLNIQGWSYNDGTLS